LRFAIFGLTSGAALIASESICRAIVINRLGIDKMGIYSPITSWGNVFQGFILSSLGIYLFPRISEAQSNTETNGVINDFFRLITFIMMPFIILAIPFRNIIIPIFYSRDFMEASVYLPWHFIGIAFYSWFFVLSQVMAPVGLIRLHGILTIVMSGLNILIVYFLTPEIGLYGWMMKFILSPILFFVIYYILLARIIDLRISARNALLMSYLIAVPLLLLTLDNSAARYYLSVFFILVCWFFLSNNEKSAIIGKLKSLGR
jgi:PST family polysaccharide transporter